MADLYGTYDKRIKLTISDTNIEATLTWFPITVFLISSNSAQGEEVFTEMTADADFDKVAFTKTDGTTELYADCELFDYSGGKAIYHVSLDGWEISDSATTDLYMYYDKDAGHNTDKVSMSGGTAAQSVWDGNFDAVYHMNDPPAFTGWTEQYEGDAEPDSDGWSRSGDDYASVSSGILTIDTSDNDTFLCGYYKNPAVNFTNGFYLKTRVKLSSDMAAGDDQLRYTISDGVIDVDFAIRDGSIYYNDNSDWKSEAVTTTDNYHVYEVYVLSNNYYIYVDGVLKVSALYDVGIVGSDMVKFGDGSTNRMCKAEIDYVYYALDVGYNPVEGITDSTSNANHGTKLSANNPVEAAGKVGQGQDFSEDYIYHATFWDTMPSNLTIEACIKADVIDVDQYFFSKNNIIGEDRIKTLIAADNTVYIFGEAADGGNKVCNSVGEVTAATWYYFAGVHTAASALKVYLNDVEATGDTLAAIGAGTADHMVIGAGDSGVASPFDGVMDEVRLSNTNRTAAWLKGTYNSLFDTLLTYGSEEVSEAVDNAIFFGTNQ